MNNEIVQRRDEFTIDDKGILAKRVGSRCSNPGCGQSTSGPQEDPGKAINVGVAAHITAASPGGPRFDASLNSEQRRSVENGIWLCQTCAKLIDNDTARYTTDVLKRWKSEAEWHARQALENRHLSAKEPSDVYRKLERQMPELLVEMRKDLAEHPLSREFVILKRSWAYRSVGHELMYYLDDHLELKSKLRIMENVGVVINITCNRVDRYVMSEELVEYLTSGPLPRNRAADDA